MYKTWRKIVILCAVEIRSKLITKVLRPEEWNDVIVLKLPFESMVDSIDDVSLEAGLVKDVGDRV